MCTVTLAMEKSSKSHKFSSHLPFKSLTNFYRFLCYINMYIFLFPSSSSAFRTATNEWNEKKSGNCYDYGCVYPSCRVLSTSSRDVPESRKFLKKLRYSNLFFPLSVGRPKKRHKKSRQQKKKRNPHWKKKKKKKDQMFLWYPWAMKYRRWWAATRRGSICNRHFYGHVIRRLFYVYDTYITRLYV